MGGEILKWGGGVDTPLQTMFRLFLLKLIISKGHLVKYHYDTT